MGYSNDRFGIVNFRTSTGGLWFSRVEATGGSIRAATGVTNTAKWCTHLEFKSGQTATVTSTGRGTLPR